jgi:multidrug resistance efflux pump
MRVTLKAAAAGAIVRAELDAEGKTLHDKRIVQIDDRVERIELDNAKRNMTILRRMLSLNETTLPALKESMERQKEYYERLKRLSTASQTQKDNAFNAYAAALAQYTTIKEKILTLRKQINDTEAAIAKLEDIIEKKSIVIDGYLFKLLVRRGEYVAPGTPLAVVDDTSKAKLVIFVPSEIARGIEKRTVYIDGKKSDATIHRVWKVADDTYMSSYRVEIVLDAPKDYFSKLVQVELK